MNANHSPTGLPASTFGANLTDEQKSVMARILTRLIQLGAEATMVPNVSEGPVVTVYRMIPTGGTTVARLEAYEDDLSVALAKDVVVSRLPNEGYVGVYVPNVERKDVLWRDCVAKAWPLLSTPKLTETERIDNLLGSKHVRRRSLEIPLLLGVNHLGEAYVEDLTTLPHFLIAGSTGGGKSVFLKALIATLVYTMRSDEVGLYLSDTKQVEFGYLKGLPHLLDEISNSTVTTLEYMDRMAAEVERRLQLFGKDGHANIQEYNAAHEEAKLQYQVLVIDELADILSMPGSKRGQTKLGETKLDLLVRRARAAGCHVIAATQSASVDVITGTIKRNLPARLTFRLPTASDSMTIIGASGANHLLTRGDMLLASPNKTGLVRLHSPFTSIQDIKSCVEVAKLKEARS